MNPNLPTLSLTPLKEESQEFYVKGREGQYVLAKSKRESSEEDWVQSVKDRMASLFSASGDVVKQFMKSESNKRATAKRPFLPEERTAMVTEDEKELILSRAFEYIFAVMELILINLDFQVHCYLVEGFKTELGKTFKNRLTNDADWEKLVEPDSTLQDRINVVQDKISSLVSSLQEVERLQRRL